MANALYPSDACKRLVWRIPAPLESAIRVSSTPCDHTGSGEPYFQQTLAGVSWHQVSQQCVSFTPCESITIKTPLDSWAAEWEEHHEHADPDDEGCEFAEDDDDGPGELLRCCGEERPQAPPPLVVTATDKEYVTVHDYVSTVHAWLMEHFDNISSAVNVWDDGEAPPGQKLYVHVSNLRALSVSDEEMWQQLQQIRPV